MVFNFQTANNLFIKIVFFSSNAHSLRFQSSRRSGAPQRMDAGETRDTFHANAEK